VQEFLFDVHNSYGLSEPTGEKRNSFFIYTYMHTLCLCILCLRKPNIVVKILGRSFS
jgi:hypothetical protein